MIANATTMTPRAGTAPVNVAMAAVMTAATAHTAIAPVTERGRATARRLAITADVMIRETV